MIKRESIKKCIDNAFFALASGVERHPCAFVFYPEVYRHIIDLAKNHVCPFCLKPFQKLKYHLHFGKCRRKYAVLINHLTDALYRFRSTREFVIAGQRYWLVNNVYVPSLDVAYLMYYHQEVEPKEKGLLLILFPWLQKETMKK